MWKQNYIHCLKKKISLEKEMATHSSILVFLSGKFHGQRSLVGYSP